MFQHGKKRYDPKTLQYLMGRSDIGVALNAYLHLGFEDALEELKLVVNDEQQNGISKQNTARRL